MRPTLFISVAVGALLIVAGCSSSAPTQPGGHMSADRWTRDASGLISVGHPVGWHLRRFREVSSFSTALMFFSNRAVTAPCTSSSTPTGTRISCWGLPRAHLNPGGFVIGWFSNGMPVRRGYHLLAHTDGHITRIDGHLAKIADRVATSACKREGGTALITATIATGPGTSISMLACMSAPSNLLRGQVLKSLRSVSL